MFIANEPINPATGLLYTADVNYAPGESDFLLFDDFAVSGVLNGRTPKVGPAGQVWVEKNAATSAAVDGVTITTPGISVVGSSGLSSNVAVPGAGNAYNCIQLSETPGEVGFTFTLADNAHSYTPTAAVWNGGAMANVGGFHPQIGSGTDITKLIFGGSYYKGGTGVGANTWDDQATGIGTFTFTPRSLYTMRCFIQGDWVYYLCSDASGNIVSRQLTLNTGMGATLGPWFFLQIFNAGVAYRSVWARKKSAASASIGALPGGLDNTPIGLRGQSPAQFSSLRVGSGTPANVFSVRYDGNPAYGPLGVESYQTGNAVWEMYGSGTGLGSELWLTPWYGRTYTAKIIHDNNLNLKWTDGDGVNFFGKNRTKTPYLMALPNYASDAAAATGGVAIGELYRNGSAIQQRVT